MKPLHIPRIRRLDLTAQYWRYREISREMSGRIVSRLLMPSLARRYPIAPIAEGETVRFRRPLAYLPDAAS